MNNPIFLTLAEVLGIHNNQIELYGGDQGVRDIKLLESALAQPEATFQGKWLHEDIFLMASAYAFHICKNHPFIDGNKRTALACALVFLEVNGISLIDPDEKLFDGMIGIATNRVNKQAFGELLKRLPTE